MNEDIRQHGIIYRICDSIPIVGKPLALICDHIETGIAEHGRLAGTARGLLTGLTIAIVLLVAAEAITFAFELGRFEINMRWGESIKAARRQAAEDRGIEDYKLHKIHVGERPEIARRSVTYYPVDRSKDARIVNGNLTPGGVLEFLDQFQHKTLTSASLEWLQPGAAVSPFFFSNASHGVAAAEVPGKGECVFAAFDDGIILIPMASYKASGLTMKEEVGHEKQ